MIQLYIYIFFFIYSPLLRHFLKLLLYAPLQGAFFKGSCLTSRILLMPQTIQGDFCLSTWLTALEREGVQRSLHARCFMCFFLFDPRSNPEATFSPDFSLQDPEMFLFPKIPFSTPFSYASSVVCAPVALTCIDRLLLSFSSDTEL